jgi:hypothetical protein
VRKTGKYPYSLKAALQENQFENVIDSNMFSAYIHDELSVPKIDDPRKLQVSKNGIERYPGYVKAAHINQIFAYTGFIKRIDNREYREYLPVLFRELNRFLRVLEEIVFTLDVTIPQEIYAEQKEGINNFLASFNQRSHYGIEWIEDIWRHQKNYLENIDMLIETLKVRGRVFDFSETPLYETIVKSCKDLFSNVNSEYPADSDFGLVANCCLRAACDNKSKTIWSGDSHILMILKILYDNSELKKAFPQIYLRAGYFPFHYAQSFP